MRGAAVRTGLDNRLSRLPRTPAWRCVYYALIYLVIAHLSRLAVPENVGLAYFWPAAGVAFLWVLFLLRLPGGVRRWEFGVSLVLLAAATYLVNWWSGLTTTENLALTLGGGLVHPIVAAGYYARTGPYGTLHTRARLLDLLVGAILGGLASMPFGPLASVLSAGDTWWTLPMWVLRQVTGTFLVAIIGLRLLRRHQRELPQRSAGHALLITIVSVVFVGLTFFVMPQVPQSFLFVSLVIWVASTRRTNETFLHALALSFSSLGLTVAGYGPFAHQSPMLQAALAEGLMLVLGLCSMSIVLAREEQARLVNQVSASERATAEQAVLMDRIVESMDDGLMVFAEDGSVMIANERARLLLGWQPEQAAEGDDEALELLYSESAPEPRIVNLTLAGQTPAPVDLLPRPGAGGAQRILSARAVPCVGDEGSMQVVVVLLDVTHERRRTAELTSFAGVIAHDLRNPLGAIEGWAELLADEIEDTHPGLGRNALRRIDAAAQRMRGILDGLLSYSVARDGELTATQVPLGDLAREIVEARSSAASVTGGTTSHFTVDADVQVFGDRALIAQVLDNLIGNAAKYTQPGQAPSIDVRAVPAGDDWARIEVADRGIGLPAGQEEAVFAEFHRVPEHRGGFVGTGLGLSICRRIVERHGGRIAAMARPGGGSVFAFTLSRVPDPQGPGPDPLAEVIDDPSAPSVHPHIRETGVAQAVAAAHSQARVSAASVAAASTIDPTAPSGAGAGGSGDAAKTTEQ